MILGTFFFNNLLFRVVEMCYVELICYIFKDQNFKYVKEIFVLFVTYFELFVDQHP